MFENPKHLLLCHCIRYHICSGLAGIVLLVSMKICYYTNVACVGGRLFFICRLEHHFLVKPGMCMAINARRNRMHTWCNFPLRYEYYGNGMCM